MDSHRIPLGKKLPSQVRHSFLTIMAFNSIIILIISLTIIFLIFVIFFSSSTIFSGHLVRSKSGSLQMSSWEERVWGWTQEFRSYERDWQNKFEDRIWSFGMAGSWKRSQIVLQGLWRGWDLSWKWRSRSCDEMLWDNYGERVHSVSAGSQIQTHKVCGSLCEGCVLNWTLVSGSMECVLWSNLGRRDWSAEMRSWTQFHHLR